MKEESYIDKNKKVYDSLASAYDQTSKSRRDATEELVEFLQRYIQSFNLKKALDCGPGNGEVAKQLCKIGIDVTGIEISNEMGAIASKNAPQLDLLIGNFLDYDFQDKKFDLIVAKNFIHLFKEKDAKDTLNKMVNLLTQKGIILVYTSLHKEFREGFMKKIKYPNAPERYRICYTGEKLKKLVSGLDVKILEYSELYREINTMPGAIGTVRIILGKESLIKNREDMFDKIK